ncbi:hypothetical protein GYMLUDRAFT_253326 [Collybiopsis luxurians FD-317 M1]|uniref:JmjC domain-containing protein n=1 Tax=Collybiopsis luxurians FD-317 M1 TaxID=944289 RepID=A0A0D0AIT9_9AGAR|nr:hypothetical protein GYMLUDRAFT_253326 [Collybiopsis luxurians FD-317 M1]
MPLLKIDPLSTRKQKRRARNKAQTDKKYAYKRQRRNAKRAQTSGGKYDKELLPISSTGFQGKRTQSLFKHLARNEILAKLMYYDWDATYDLVICDREGRGLVYCLANPRDPQWLAYIHPELCRILEKARLNGKFTAKQMYHRRGDFVAQTIGYSHGGGQTSPSNTKHRQRDGQVLETLLSNDAVQRVSGLNTKQMTRLYEPRTPPSARISPTPYSPPPPSTLVLKPLLPTTLAMETTVQEVAPSPAQDTKGGELVLWDLGIAIRFPPGSSIIILSAILRHSNLPIQPGEKRYSITQYSAGALFRFVANGMKNDKDFLPSATPEQVDEYIRERRTRWENSLKKFKDGCPILNATPFLTTSLSSLIPLIMPLFSTKFLIWKRAGDEAAKTETGIGQNGIDEQGEKAASLNRATPERQTSGRSELFSFPEPGHESGVHPQSGFNESYLESNSFLPSTPSRPPWANRNVGQLYNNRESALTAGGRSMTTYGHGSSAWGGSMQPPEPLGSLADAQQNASDWDTFVDQSSTTSQRLPLLFERSSATGSSFAIPEISLPPRPPTPSLPPTHSATPPAPHLATPPLVLETSASGGCPTCSSRKTSSIDTATLPSLPNASRQFSDAEDPDEEMTPLSPPPATPPPRVRPYCIPCPKLPPVDLLTDVVGIQVHQDAQKVLWPCGWETVLPTGIEDGINVLESDAERVRWMADPKNAVSDEHSMIKYLDKSAYGDDDGSLIEDIRYLNARNYVVVVPGGIFHHKRAFRTIEDVSIKFGLGIDDDLKLQYHDLKMRAKDYQSGLFRVDTEVANFIADVTNPNVVGMILDVPVAHQAIPHPYHLIDDGANSFRHLNSDQRSTVLDVKSATLHRDSLFASTWGLLHHAGTFTNVHQDAEGYSIAGQVLGDRDDPQPKIWAIMTFKDPSVALQAPAVVADRMQSICNYINIRNGSGWKWDGQVWEGCQVELMYLCPGDMFFQPPGALHLVYTPRACVAFGGHFYSYDSLHLTEWTRRLQHLKSNFITNQNPARVKEVLNWMMLNFPNKGGRVFYKRAVVALCRMILVESEYVHQGQQRIRVGNALDRRAAHIAILVARMCLGMSSPLPREDEEAKIKLHLDELVIKADYFDPGEPFTLSKDLSKIVEEMAVTVWAHKSKKNKT